MSAFILLAVGIIAISVGIWLGGKDAKRILNNLVNEAREKDEKVELLNRTLGELEETNKNYIAHNQELYNKMAGLQALVDSEMKNNKAILSQKKSSETRLGNISEQLVPFLDACNYDPANMHFLGQPIDYIVFDYDAGEIVFVEVKSGNSKESKRQKLIKNIIKSGRVYYEKIRIGERNVNTRREGNYE